MAFFNSSSPAYKKAASLNASAYAPATASNGLASMFGSLLGGTTPVYKTVDGQVGRAPSSSSDLLRIFIGTTPSYKTASQSVNSELADDDGADEAEYADDACPSPTDTVVLL